MTVRIFIVQYLGIATSADPLPTPHQGKVQIVKVDGEANLPSGQSQPSLYIHLCFHRTAIPNGDQKPACVRA